MIPNFWLVVNLTEMHRQVNVQNYKTMSERRESEKAQLPE